MKKNLVAIFVLIASVAQTNAQPFTARDLTQKDIWQSGSYLNQNQKTIMGYLAQWNANTTEKHVVVCAHRGAWGIESPLYRGYRGSTKIYIPENTLAALWNAGLRKSEMVELDVKLSRDNVVIISHDWTGNRTTDPNYNPDRIVDNSYKGKWAIASKNESFWTARTNRVFLKSASPTTRYTIVNPTVIDEFTAGMYKIPTLEDVFKFYKYSSLWGAYGVQKPILSLDVKNVAHAKRCLDLVRKYNAWDWVIFKMNADAIWNKKATVGKELDHFSRAIGFRYRPDIGRYKYLSNGVAWRVNGVSEGQLLRIVPIFTTNQAYKIPILTVYNQMKNKSWCFTFEVNIKEGGNNYPSETRFYEMAELAKKSLKLGIFNSEPDAKGSGGDQSQNGYFFDGGNGSCCYQLKDKLVRNKYRKLFGGLKILEDEQDRRGNGDFLVGALNNQYRDNAWRFRWITTDAVDRYQDWLNSIGLRPYSVQNYSTAQSVSISESPSTSDFSMGDSTIQPYYYRVPVLNCYERLPRAALKVAANSITTAVIGTNNNIYIYDNEANTWVGHGRQAIDIAVDNNGLVWYIDANNQIWKQGEDGQWVQLSGRALKIAAGGNEENGMVAIIYTDGTIYRITEDGTAWYNLGGWAKEITVDANGSIWHIGSSNKIWRLEVDQNTGNDFWSQVPGNGYANKITASDDGSVAVIGTDGNIWGFNSDISGWQMIYNTNGGQYKEIALATSSNAVALKANGEIWRLDDCTPVEDDTEIAVAAQAMQSNIATDSIVNNVTKNIHIFPNPAHDKVTVQLAAGMEKATVTIVSSLGTIVATDNTTGLQRVIIIAGKPSGTYLVRVTTKDGVSTTQKLIVQ